METVSFCISPPPGAQALNDVVRPDFRKTLPEYPYARMDPGIGSRCPNARPAKATP
jgi:hypothetical protein